MIGNSPARRPTLRHDVDLVAVVIALGCTAAALIVVVAALVEALR